MFWKLSYFVHARATAFDEDSEKPHLYSASDDGYKCFQPQSVNYLTNVDDLNLKGQSITELEMMKSREAIKDAQA